MGFLCGWSWLATSGSFGQDAAAESATSKAASAAPPATASAAELDAWVGQLGSSNFRDRETAASNLLKQSAAAIPAVLRGIDGHGLEVAARGIGILQQLAVSGELGVEAQAIEALRELARPRITAAARRAAESLERIDFLRQEQALDFFRVQGAQIDPLHQEMAAERMRSLFTIEFGAAWRGAPSDLSRLALLRDVEQVNFVDGKFSDECAPFVAAMPNLMQLKIKRGTMTLAGLQAVKAAPKLSTLMIYYVPVSDDCLALLQEFPLLNHLVLYGTGTTEPACLRLAENRGIRIDRRDGAFLGISPADNAPPCLIQRVTEGSAAERGGLQRGDIIVRYAGRPVDSFESLKTLISANTAGDTVEIVVVRDGAESTHSVTLGEWN